MLGNSETREAEPRRGTMGKTVACPEKELGLYVENEKEPCMTGFGAGG